jgi:hypothetical protein
MSDLRRLAAFFVLLALSVLPADPAFRSAVAISSSIPDSNAHTEG